MTLDRYRHVADRLLGPWVRAASALGLSANGVSVVAFAVALGAAGAFAGLDRGPLWAVAGATLVVANGWLDVVDGELARREGSDSPAGDLLDHVLDRYADVAIIVGLAAGVGRYGLGLAAVTGVLLTSYLGTQAQAVGLDRVYAGVLGRADRLVLVAAVGFVSPLVGSVGGYHPVTWLLAVFAVVGHLTAVQRFLSAWRALS